MGCSEVNVRGPLLALLLLLGAAATARAELVWRPLENGLELSQPKVPGSHRAGDGTVTLVRIDPAKVKLGLAMAKFEGGKERTARQWSKEKGFLFAINAGLYRDDMTNVGYMRDGRRVNNPKQNRYTSIVAFNPRKSGADPVMLWDRDCDGAGDWRGYDTVVQNIRLISCKRRVTWPNAEKQVSLAVLALDGQGRMVFALSQSPHTAAAFARMLLRWPLDLRRAQYLEGGRPTQMYLEAGGVTLHLNGLCGGTLGCIGVSGAPPDIPNVIGVTKR